MYSSFISIYNLFYLNLIQFNLFFQFLKPATVNLLFFYLQQYLDITSYERLKLYKTEQLKVSFHRFKQKCIVNFAFVYVGRQQLSQFYSIAEKKIRTLPARQSYLKVAQAYPVRKRRNSVWNCVPYQQIVLNCKLLCYSLR